MVQKSQTTTLVVLPILKIMGHKKPYQPLIAGCFSNNIHHSHTVDGQKSCSTWGWDPFIPLFYRGFIHPNGGWAWDFCSINRIFLASPGGNVPGPPPRLLGSVCGTSPPGPGGWIVQWMICKSRVVIDGLENTGFFEWNSRFVTYEYDIYSMFFQHIASKYIMLPCWENSLLVCAARHRIAKPSCRGNVSPTMTGGRSAKAITKSAKFCTALD